MAEPHTFLTDLVLRAAWLPPGLIWGAALIAGLACALRIARSRDLDESEMYWVGVSAIAGGLLGSHLLGLYVYRAVNGGPDVWWHVWEGGKSFYGGLGGAMVAIALYLRVRDLPALKYADVLAPATGLGYGVGRWACFLNGDDFGTPVKGWFSVSYGPDSEAFIMHVLAKRVLTSESFSLSVHPVQLYASVLGLVIFLVLRRERRTGESVSLFLLLYGGGRFLLEFLRGDFAASVGPLSLHQVLSLALIAAGGALFFGVRTQLSSHGGVALPAVPRET